MLVNRSPEPDTFPTDARGHLIQVPGAARRRFGFPQLRRRPRTELGHPAEHRHVADANATLGEQLFHIPEAEREAQMEPDSAMTSPGKQ